MNDSLLYKQYVLATGYPTVYPDTIHSDSSIVSDVMNFIQMETVHIAPISHSINANSDIITYVLIVMLGIIAVIWHFMNDRFSTMFSIKTDSVFNRSGNTNTAVPGTIITGFFWLNFIISLGILCYLIITKYYSNYFPQLSFFELMIYIYCVIISLLVYRVVIIYGTSVIFKTQKLREQQVITGRNIQFIIGVFLTPILILILYINNSFFIFIIISIAVLLQIVRLIKIVIIGKSSTIFSVLHIILYLCALEIVPVLVLLRMIGNAS